MTDTIPEKHDLNVFVTVTGIYPLFENFENFIDFTGIYPRIYGREPL